MLLRMSFEKFGEFEALQDEHSLYISANCQQFLNHKNKKGISLWKYLDLYFPKTNILALPDTAEFKIEGKNVAALCVDTKDGQTIHYWYGI